MKDGKIQKTDDRLILYPKIDITRTNLHGNKTKIMKPFPKPKEKTPDK